MSTRRPLIELGLTFLAFLGLVVAATWPFAADFDQALFFHAGRFDGYGTIWFSEHAWRVLQGQAQPLSTTEVAWPEGLDLRQADSFLYGAMTLPFRAVLPPVAAFNAFSFCAIAATATAGAWLARGPLGCSRLSSLGAGMIMGFNGLMHTYRIEGEAYLLAGLFLPLMAGMLLRAARSGAPRDGALAALAMAALAWSSGYYAIDGALVGITLGLPLIFAEARARDGRPVWPALVAFVALSLVLILPLTWLVLGALDQAIGARGGAGEDPLVTVTLDSVTLSGLLVPYPDTAFLRQGRIHYAGLAALVLGCCALVVQPPRRTLPWLAVGLTGIVLALGPFLRLADTSAAGVSLPYAWIYEVVPEILVYRMPARFMALAFLGFGALAALLLDRLTREGLGLPWRATLVGLLLFDGVLMTGFATDITRAPAAVPAGYADLSGDGAVLDLWGRDPQMLRHAGLSTFYQAHHGQPVMADFTRTDGPQDVLNRRLALALLARDTAEVRGVLEVLHGIGVSDIALHSRSFAGTEADLVRDGLSAACTAVQPSQEDIDDDDPVEIFAVPAVGQLSMAEGLDKISTWSAE